MLQTLKHMCRKTQRFLKRLLEESPPGAWKPSSHSMGQRSPDLANVPCLTNFYLSQPMGNMRNQRMNESIVNDEWVNMVG